MSPSSLFLPETPPPDRSRVPDDVRPRSDSTPEQSFSKVMERAATTKTVRKDRCGEAPSPTVDSEKAKAEKPSTLNRRHALSVARNIAGDASDQDVASKPAGTAAAAIQSTAAMSTTSQEADGDDEGGEGKQSSESNEEGKLPSNVIVLALPVATIVPLPPPCELPAVSSPTVGDANATPIDAGPLPLPTASTAEDSISPSNPLMPPAAEERTASESENGFDPRSMGLHAVRRRESLALDLRAAIARLEAEEKATQDTGSNAPDENNPARPDPKIIPFPIQSGPDSRIIPVHFGRSQPELSGSAGGGNSTESQLPTEDGNAEKSAGLNPQNAEADTVIPEAPNPAKPNAKGHVHWRSDAAATSVSDGGTSAARKDRNMDSRSPSAPFDPPEEGTPLSEVPSDAGNVAPRETSSSSGLGAAVEWSSPAQWHTMRDLSPDVAPAASVDSGSVERVSKMVGREVMLFRQHSSDSMAVVLRPDANTELFLHFSRRDGQIEASVRCERGDFHQLNALWSQLQESLAHQKVRLHPLQEAAADTGSGHRYSDGFNRSGHDESSRHSGSDNDFMDEWPAPASPDEQPAHVRSRRESGHRLSTSRPGWETWA